VQTDLNHGIWLNQQQRCPQRDGRYSRTIHLLNRTIETAGIMRWREVPIVGDIAAGSYGYNGRRV